MNWLRDNILKILIILGVTIIAIVIVAFLMRPKGDTVVSGTKYGELETKLQNAAIKYVKSHKKLLPATTDDVTKIKLETLQSNNYIGKLVAVDNSSTKCNGYVEIEKLSDEQNDYRYTPYISCGEYYETKTIGNYIIDKETNNGTFNRTSEDGLYKIGEEYVFRGENINNYIMLDQHLYRIIKIDKDNYVELISTTRTNTSYVWDNRYNVDRKREEGINTFLKSRLHDSLVSLYDDTFFTSTEKDYIVSHDYCIGRRSQSDGNIYSDTECRETTNLKVGLISLSEYARASIDPNCSNTFARSCANYNYFTTLGNKSSYSYTTLTAVLDNTYQYYRIRYGEVETAKTSSSNLLHPVIYINNNTIYSSGSGTLADPYVVR